MSHSLAPIARWASHAARAACATSLLAALAFAQATCVRSALATDAVAASTVRKLGRQDPLRDELLRAQFGEFSKGARPGPRRLARAEGSATKRDARADRRRAQQGC